MAMLQNDKKREQGLQRDGDPFEPETMRARRASARTCGTCSHCCTVLRVDELAKAAGRDCRHQRGSDGCGIYSTRPSICRGYKCLWLQGGLEEDERPDATGGIVDLESRGTGVGLVIREISVGAFEKSPALQTIARRYREEMPVRIIDTDDLMNPDRPFRVLAANETEYRVCGEWTELYRQGKFVSRRRLGWAERLARRVGIAWRLRRMRRAGTIAR